MEKTIAGVAAAELEARHHGVEYKPDPVAYGFSRLNAWKMTCRLGGELPVRAGRACNADAKEYVESAYDRKSVIREM